MESFCPFCGNSLIRKQVDGRDRLYCEECSRIIWQNPKPVAWLLVRKDEEYLLVKRANEPDRGEWDIPGGFLELDETFEEGAVRELEEETGVQINQEGIEILDTLGFHRGEHHVVGVVFHTEVDEIPDVEAGDDAAEAQFWRLEEFDDSEEVLRDACKELLD